jgi:hypothetical protein
MPLCRLLREGTRSAEQRNTTRADGLLARHSWGYSLARFKALDCQSRDRGFKSRYSRSMSPGRGDAPPIARTAHSKESSSASSREPPVLGVNSIGAARAGMFRSVHSRLAGGATTIGWRETGGTTPARRPPHPGRVAQRESALPTSRRLLVQIQSCPCVVAGRAAWRVARPDFPSLLFLIIW